MKETVVFYHDDSDGIASALAAYIKYGNSATYLPVQYKQPVPNVPLNKDTQLFIVDFSFPIEILRDLESKVGSILVIDHHKTAQDQLKDFDRCIFDMNKSGAMLSWEYFHPNVEPPILFKLVEDRDLWRFDLEDSKAFEAGIQASGQYRNFDYWEELINSQNALEHVLANGRLLVKAQDDFMDSFVKTRKFAVVKFRGNRCAIFNTTYLISDLGNAVYKQTSQPVDMTMSYFVSTKGEMIFSLRAPKDNEVDCGSIALSLGGGGHTKAAGFSMPLVQGAEFVAELLNQ